MVARGNWGSSGACPGEIPLVRDRKIIRHSHEMETEIHVVAASELALFFP